MGLGLGQISVFSQMARPPIARLPALRERQCPPQRGIEQPAKIIEQHAKAIEL